MQRKNEVAIMGHPTFRSVVAGLGAVSVALLLCACPLDRLGGIASPSKAGETESASNARLVMFVGIDISGSFMRSKNFDDALDFLAHYLVLHFNGYGGLDVPHSLFVGSIGGATPDEPKTFYPIQAFENKSVVEIKAKLHEIFPPTKQNPFTDFNAFFAQIAEFVRSRNLVLRPISIVMLSDGIPDAPGMHKGQEFGDIALGPLENLARKITLRLLYTDAVVGMNWQTKVKRQRVRIWSQDANVMRDWKDPKILEPDVELKDKNRLFGWLKSNVDFPVRVKRVN